MASVDLSLNNTLIKKYFDGSNDYVPTSEFFYIQSHPLVTPNFLSDIEETLLKTSLHIKSRNMGPGPGKRILALGVSLAELLPVQDGDREKAGVALSILREIYGYCSKLIAKS